MKYRTDFVTNSSSTSFASAGFSIIAALLAFFGLGSCKQEEPEAGMYTLQASPRQLVLKPGETATLEVAVYEVGPDGEGLADDASIELSSQSPELTVSPASGEGRLLADVEASATAPAGEYAISVSAKAGGVSMGLRVAVQVEPNVELELTFPVGRSPKVFTTGWVFGARCIVNPGTPDEQDVSETVQWGGSGSFSPAIGSQSRPIFNGPGSNLISLTCEAGGSTVTKSFDIEAVSPVNYARLGDQARVDADAHGCPACPHVAVGPIVSGSLLVLINGQSAARVGDSGVHAACCGPNTFTIIEGDPQVLIDGRPAAKKGDATQHCGGVGKIIQGSPGD